MRLRIVIARWLGRFPCMCHERVVGPDGKIYIAKRRVWHSALSRPVGNLMLRMRPAPARMLRRGEWLARERRMFAALYGMEVAARDGRLLIPELPGVPLNTLLMRRDVTVERKLKWLRAAAMKLRALHGLSEAGEDEERRACSHGDATALNVLIDPDSGEARWIDFDTAHCARTPAPLRHADDLRALMVTAASWLPAAQVLSALDAISSAYGLSEIIDCLHQQLITGTLDQDFYHLAHATQRHAHLVKVMDWFRKLPNKY